MKAIPSTQITGYGIGSSLQEPPRKKQRTGSNLSHFQGKWFTNLGILHVNGAEGYYGVNSANCTIADKFIKNITVTGNGKRIRGRWHWASNDQTFGKFELTLLPGGRSFTGT